MRFSSTSTTCSTSGIVADGSAALDAAGGVNRSRFREQRLGQAGLAAARLADECDRPDAFDGILHRPCLHAASFIAEDCAPGRSGRMCIKPKFENY